MSKGEEKIIEILKKEKFDFEKEKTFSDLKRGRYRFDFYVHRGRAKDALVEYQGEQHYMYISKFYDSRADFLKAKERDRRKISYCLANQIPLYIIPFWELDNIHEAKDLFKNKYRAKDKWKNDKDWNNRKI